jgi:DNA-directed RNA polymerase specialized sigma24 family protein
MDRDVLDQSDNVDALRAISIAPGRPADRSDSARLESTGARRHPDGVVTELFSVLYAADDTGETQGEDTLDLLDVADVADVADRYGLPRAVPFDAEALSVADPDVDVCEQAVTNIQVGLLYRHLRALPEVEARVLRLVYGLGDEEPLTHEEIAAQMSISPAHVRDLVRRAIGGLRALHVAVGAEAA